MTGRPTSTHREGLKAARLLMVLSSISPLFILWAIRGNCLVADDLGYKAPHKLVEHLL